jgi:signal peptidase I
MNGSEKVSATLGCELAGEVVSTFGEVRLRVLGTSMVPSIHPGDLISVQRVSLSEISSGEIALYSREGRLFAHRVVAHAGSPDRPLLIMRGDRHRHNDPPVCASELLGRVHLIERGHRRLQPATKLSMRERVIAVLLRTSIRATYLYLRLDARRQRIFPRRTECRV